jgi:hypothetical protein
MSDKNTEDRLPMVIEQESDFEDESQPMAVSREQNSGRGQRRSNAPQTFRDKVYKSRVLILPGERQLPVAKGRVTVAADDVDALAYLQKHADFEPLLE